MDCIIEVSVRSVLPGTCAMRYEKREGAASDDAFFKVVPGRHGWICSFRWGLGRLGPLRNSSSRSDDDTQPLCRDRLAPGPCAPRPALARPSVQPPTSL